MSDQRKDEWPNLDDQPSNTNEGGTTDSGNKSDVANELQELGQRLAATARTLWQSEQRQELQKDVTDGLRLLRDQLSGVVDTVRTNPKVQTLKDQVGQKVDAGRSSDAFEEVRTGLSNGLRALNEQLQRFTERMERRTPPPMPRRSRRPNPPPPPAQPCRKPAASWLPTPRRPPTSSPVARSPKPPATPRPIPTAPEGPAADSQR
ncbi:MAG: hypothetical protein U0841_10525 [Chloroflexia bacterium]